MVFMDAGIAVGMTGVSLTGGAMIAASTGTMIAATVVIAVDSIAMTIAAVARSHRHSPSNSRVGAALATTRRQPHLRPRRPVVRQTAVITTTNKKPRAAMPGVFLLSLAARHCVEGVVVGGLLVWPLSDAIRAMPAATAPRPTM